MGGGILNGSTKTFRPQAFLVLWSDLVNKFYIIISDYANYSAFITADTIPLILTDRMIISSKSQLNFLKNVPT